ncbi:hypothetical protein [Actinoplanes sp. NPDC051851]|uniref:hypothetical protein n=1 Tax=Actinoplanes sp. NPDC051851 TaxID=3154753 RepID=UPI003425FCBA
MIGALVIILVVWAAAAVAYFWLGDPVRKNRKRDWRFGPVLATGFAAPIGSAYGYADWAGFIALLIGGAATFALLLWMLATARP